jgi:hypothetical protein
MELSPSRVRNNGMFSNERNDFPRGSSQKPKYGKHQRECLISSEDEGRSDGELIAQGKSKGHHRPRRDKSATSESDQSPQVCR